MYSPFVQVEAIVFGTMIAWGFWGFHTILFAWLIGILGRRHQIRKFLLGACILGYVLSTYTIILYSYTSWVYIELGWPKAPATIPLRRATIAAAFVYCTAVTLSDAVQMWRCTVLCGNRKWLIALLGFLWGTTAIFGLLNEIFSIVFSFDPTFTDMGTLVRLEEALLLAFLVPSILLNIIATGVILFRVQTHTKDIVSSFGKEHQSFKRLRLLSVFLVEGGAIYTAIQLFYAIVSFLATGGDERAQLPIASRPIVVVISGMYPVTITLFAELARHMTDTYSYKGSNYPSTNGSGAGGSSIGISLGRPHGHGLRNRPSEQQGLGQVQMSVMQTKVVDKEEEDVHSMNETAHSAHSARYTHHEEGGSMA